MDLDRIEGRAWAQVNKSHTKKGEKIYHTPLALISDGSRVLLLREYSKRFERWEWRLPGGHTEFGEEGSQTAIREILEELGIVVIALMFWQRFNHIDVERRKHFMYEIFRGNYVQALQKRKTKKDVVAGWFLPQEVEEMPNDAVSGIAKRLIRAHYFEELAKMSPSSLVNRLHTLLMQDAVNDEALEQSLEMALERLKRQKNEPGVFPLFAKKPFIVLIDDERFVLEATGEMLKRSDLFEVNLYSDPEVALRDLQTEKLKSVDLVITDYLMQQINGDQLIRQLRIRKKDLKAVILTAHPNICLTREKVLAKPMERKKLVASIIKILSEDQPKAGEQLSLF